jgi:hypothetical protein
MWEEEPEFVFGSSVYLSSLFILSVVEQIRIELGFQIKQIESFA